MVTKESENFTGIMEVVRKHGDEHISAGKESHFKILAEKV